MIGDSFFYVSGNAKGGKTIKETKGKAHIGRVFLLPRSFNENGDIEDFYLYISPDYKRTYDAENKTFYDNDGWDNLIIAPLNQSSACFFTPDNDTHGFCKKPVNSKVTSLPQLELIDFSPNNGVVFFDGLTLSNLLLNNTGASLLYDNISYECNQLRLWLASAGDVKTVNSNFVCDSNDNFSLINHLDSGFFREKINSQSLPVSFSPYSQKFFSMGHFSRNNKQYISINEAPALYKNNQYALWDYIFKSFLHISVLYVIPANGLKVFGSDFFLLGNISYIKYHEYVVTKIMTDETFTGEYAYDFHDGSVMPIRDSRTYRLAFREAAIYENSFCDEIGVNLTYLNIDNGSLHSSDFSLSLPQPDVLTYEFDGTMSYGLYGGGGTYPCHFSDQHISSLEFFPVPFSGYVSYVLSVIGNSIFSEVITESYSHEINLHSVFCEFLNSTSRYEKVADLPDNGWRLLDDSIQCYLKLTGYLKLAGLNGQYLVFYEQRGNVNFFLNISQTLQPFPLLYNQDDLGATFFNIYNLRDVLTDNYGKKYILTCTHICKLDNYFIVLRSEYNPNIFDFDSEIERSKLF